MPPSAANAASERQRPGVGEAHDGLRGADRSDAVPGGQAGTDVVDDGHQLGVVVFELVPGLV